MENQHRKITGYRELTQDEINLMNEIKAKGLELETLINKVKNLYQPIYNEGTITFTLLNKNQKWIEIGENNLQQGLMALTRAVAKPEFF